MENIFSALKLLGPLLLTPIINRFISTFRVRQLYLSFDEVLPCTLPDTTGFLTCLHIYNKGKDKENKIEITFPNSHLCQILSSNYPGASTEKNKLLIDRILPKQVVSLMVYFKSETPLSAANKPFIKSEDANGKAYDKKANVPPSLGPAVMVISLAAAGLITMMYIALSGASIFYPYYALRYNSFIEQGFTPKYSDNVLISSKSIASNPPINLDSAYIERSKIVLPLKIKNTTTKNINVTIFHQVDDENHLKEKSRASKEFPDISKRVEAWRSIDRKYGYSPDDVLFMSDVILEPSEEKTILLAHTVIPTTTLENFNFKISIEKSGHDDPDFNDRYNFNVRDSKELPKIVELLQSMQR